MANVNYVYPFADTGLNFIVKDSGEEQIEFLDSVPNSRPDYRYFDCYESEAEDAGIFHEDFVSDVKAGRLSPVKTEFFTEEDRGNDEFYLYGITARFYRVPGFSGLVFTLEFGWDVYREPGIDREFWEKALEIRDNLENVASPLLSGAL